MDNLHTADEGDRRTGAVPLWPQWRPFSEPVEVPPLRIVLEPSGRTVELTRSDILVGRHSEADVRLPLPDVSRRHCRLVYSEGHWRVFDLHSLNGIYLNGDLVEQAFLHSGDRLRVGGFVLELAFAETGAVPGQTASIRRIPNDDPREEHRQAG